MNSLLFVFVGIVVLTNFCYTIYSHFSLKKLTNNVRSSKVVDKFVLENIIHSRTSINVLYASISIITFVLVFFGFNVQKNVTREVKKEISQAARVDLDSLKIKVDNIASFESLSRQGALDVNKTREQIREFYENVRRIPQKLYVVQALPVSKQKNQYLFSEIQPVDGTKIPKFSQPPIIMWYAYNKNSVFSTDVEVTDQGIEVGTYDEPFVIDLWIYVR